MILRDASGAVVGVPFPRTRGDDPLAKLVRLVGGLFSPHPRG